MTILHFNNQIAIQLAYNPELHIWIKDIDIQQHFGLEVVASKVIDIVWISTSKMPTNRLIKLLPQVKFECFIQLISLKNDFSVLPSQVRN